MSQRHLTPAVIRNDLILSNVSVVNLLNEEGVDKENRHEDSVISYYVDYYLGQYTNGNFSQFVWNSGWSPELNKTINEDEIASRYK
ncbi:DMP19 family protein [Chryseobacterium sp. M5A1_1a]